MLIGFPRDVANREPEVKKVKKPLDQHATCDKIDTRLRWRPKTYATRNSIKFKPPEILELLGRLKPYCLEPVGFFAFKEIYIQLTSLKFGNL